MGQAEAAGLCPRCGPPQLPEPPPSVEFSVLSFLNAPSQSQQKYIVVFTRVKVVVEIKIYKKVNGS